MVAGGVRISWADVPASVRAEIEDGLGSPVVEAVSQPGGFSPGTADRVVLADGRRAFVKAVGVAQNPDSPAVHRLEIRTLRALPEGLPVPRLLATYDDGEWVALALEDVEGRHPYEPWRADDLAAVLDLLEELPTWLTPAPSGFNPLWEEFGEAFTAWSRLRLNPPSDLDPWTLDHLDALAAWEPLMEGLLGGDTLLHLDVRADNLLLVGEGDDLRAVLVDWPWVVTGPPWVDLAAFLINVALLGGADPEEVLRSRPLTAEADPDAITALLVGVSGYFAETGRRPEAPGLPTLRAFQRAQGDVTLAWLARRLP
jgi:aminoglycoside phosphotransferase (APT) family kinase protein